MTVFRTRDIIMVLLMMIAAAMTYMVKYDAQRRTQDVRQIERRIETERDTIQLLYADWALMTQPARLQQLVTQYQDQLGLQVIVPGQIVKADDIPVRVPDAIDTIIKGSDKLIAGAGGRRETDSMHTGSIRP
ncbi:MAG: Hypothetical protein BHV28_13300 [Candidatus Tokpelaia hoelldobleri]|uniref:Uncharacterized protein n=1 Tax=Candidatus Tokpelaia hoelldobleri TaxID=1902579 RepID=A0A1U9JVY4_9HYPH|nr:MAG: Hypothetical protein BHV28_13300 [Candidatus Tokpelaia hoelldoblerii]